MWSYEEVKKKFPLGSTILLWNEEKYIIGYGMYDHSDVNYEILYASKEDSNGTHNIYKWFKFRFAVIKDLKKGMKFHNIPSNRHCGLIHPDNVILVKRPYKWIKMEMKK